MSDLVERLRDFNKSEAVRMEAADRIEQLERVLAQALATLKDGDMDMVHATIAAIDEALNTTDEPRRDGPLDVPVGPRGQKEE